MQFQSKRGLYLDHSSRFTRSQLLWPGRQVVGRDIRQKSCDRLHQRPRGPRSGNVLHGKRYSKLHGRRYCTAVKGH
jgi:hypothetical protein